MFISSSVIMVAAVLTDLSGLLCLFFSRRCYAVLPFFWMMSISFRLAACSSQTDWLIETWKRLRRISRAFRMVVSWVEMTDSTETSMRLNSSKQPHAPHWHRPEKIFPTAWHKKNTSTEITAAGDRPTWTETRVGHGLDPSMNCIGLGCVRLAGMTVTPFLISNHCSTVDAVSFKLWFIKF